MVFTFWVMLATGTLACNDHDASLDGPSDSSTDTLPIITGRDSAHRVPADTSSLDVNTTDTAYNSDSGGFVLSDTDSARSSDSDSQTTSTDASIDTAGADTLSITDTQSATADEDTSLPSDTDTLPDTGTLMNDDTSSVNIGDSDSEVPQYVTWTVMVYMAADSNLEADMLVDLSELASVQTPYWLNILILFDRHEYLDRTDGDWTGTRLFRVNSQVPGGLERLADSVYLGVTDSGDTDELDMGDGNTLDRFIQFSTNAYSADHYALVLSGHGNGWMKKGTDEKTYHPKVICSDDSGNRDGISVQQVLAPLLQSYSIEVLGFDACLMAMVEVAWAVKDTVKYMIASEANESSEGWDFYTWFTEWIKSADYSAESLIKKQVVAYRRYYAETTAPWQVTVSVVDTAMLPALGDAINAFMTTHVPADVVPSAMTFDVDYSEYYDLWHIADLAGDEGLKMAIEAAVIYSWSSNGPQTPGGLSIMFLPTFPDAYLQTSFCQDLDWC
ncbi:MAG: hypothetical protein JXX14_11675 [Deltaproteobacteria bacterium]|nr:hypothetical protein [Deltaproteobacteria bacterium]